MYDSCFSLDRLGRERLNRSPECSIRCARVLACDLLFSWQSFRAAGARASKQVLANMYKGMMGKFAIVIVGFILILSNVKPLSAVALFCGFMLVQTMTWVAPFWVSRQQKRV